MTETEQSAEATPLTFQVSGGNPDDVELAAVMAVLQAAHRAGAPAEQSDDRPLAGGWKSYHRTLRRPVNPGREAWRYSARP
ncbi:MULTISPECIES: acyl-CoA carboxylase subunit epsilon [unclassified Luteococcus]|uniref:acyl-CoA carboxylase subunit epsilon n=1 Tax=unclassified Luteococcus TaxID=2639923 RepID=UPI00313E0009